MEKREIIFDGVTKIIFFIREKDFVFIGSNFCTPKFILNFFELRGLKIDSKQIKETSFKEMFLDKGETTIYRIIGNFSQFEKELEDFSNITYNNYCKSCSSDS